MGIFTFNIHESIKDDFTDNLKAQTLSLGKMFALVVIGAGVLLMGLDALLGWTWSLLVFRLTPMLFAGAYLVYNRFLIEKFPRIFSFVYGAIILSCMISAAGICFQVFTHQGVQNIDKLGVALGTAMTILVCYLFAGVAIVSYLWLTGLPLILGIVATYLSVPLNVVDWLALATPLFVFATMGLLSGEQFFLKTKYFAVQRRAQQQLSQIEDLKLSYRDLNDENLYLVEQLKSNATFDALTAAFNRGAGLELLEKEFYFSQRNSEPMTLAYIKIDNVPWILTEYGREFADKVIVTVTETIKETIRKSDILIRIEEDEYIVVFRQCASQFAKKVIDRAHARTAGLSSQSNFEINFCAGFADSSNDEFSSSKQLIEVADQQMKAEKEKPKLDGLMVEVVPGNADQITSQTLITDSAEVAPPPFEMENTLSENKANKVAEPPAIDAMESEDKSKVG